MSSEKAIKPKRDGPGRPSLYENKALVAQFIEHASHMSVVKACQQEGMPGRTTIQAWEERHAEFRSALARARKLWAEQLACGSGDELDISDEELKEAKGAASAIVQARKSRSEWAIRMAGILDRETWGERQQIDLKAQVLNVQAFADMDGEKAEARRQAEVLEVTLPTVTAPDGEADS